MTITVISFWLPLIWALVAGIYWRFLWKAPINNWIVCLIVGAICFFWFALTFVLYLIVVAIKKGVFKSLTNSSEEPKENKS
jgi:hypothetical protein